MFDLILVALDGHPGAERVVPWVRRLAQPARGAAVRLVTVRPPGRRVTAGSRVVAYADQLDDMARAESSAYLRAVASRFQDEAITVTVEVGFGEPAACILDAAREARADLIALAGFASSTSPGSLAPRVTRAIQRQATVPVLLARRLGQRAA